MRGMRAGWLALSILALAACRETDLETATTTVERVYDVPVTVCWNACVRVAKDNALRITSVEDDRHSGILHTRRPSGTEVRFVVRGMDKLHTGVAIRVEVVDGDLADLLHDRLEAELAGGGPAGAGGANR